MKLASLMHGRDGRLVVVSNDLTRATDAFPVVSTLQAALDDWDRYAGPLGDLAQGLERGSVPSFRFHEHDCAAPLPRAYRRLVVAHAAGAPALACSDGALGPRQPVRARDENAGLIADAGIAVITGDVPAGTTGAQAASCIRLVMLAAGVSLQNRSLREAAQAADGIDTEQAFTFSPVVVTPDELGPAWHEGVIALPLLRQINQQPLQRGDAGSAADLSGLIAQAARAHALCAGTIVAAGIAIPQDQPLRFGDTVRIEMKDAAGHSIFGAIEQEMLPMAV